MTGQNESPDQRHKSSHDSKQHYVDTRQSYMPAIPHSLIYNKNYRQVQQSQLHLAAAENSADLVRYLIQWRGKSPQELDHDGNTPLLLACRYGAIEAAAVLCVAGADIMARDRFGNTPLHLACTTPRFAAVRLLLRRRLNAPDGNNAAPLHVVVSEELCCPSVILLLLDKERTRVGDAKDAHRCIVGARGLPGVVELQWWRMPRLPLCALARSRCTGPCRPHAAALCRVQRQHIGRARAAGVWSARQHAGIVRMQPAA